MPHSFVVTPLRPEFQPDARNLILRGLGEHWGSIDESLNLDLSDLIRSYSDGYFVVGYFEDELIGTGGYQAISPTTVEIRRMSVDRAFRRQGVASLILEDLIAHASRSGYRRVVLETTATWTDAISFYEESGFVKLGLRDGDMHFELRI